jgi:hypothetical protein
MLARRTPRATLGAHASQLLVEPLNDRATERTVDLYAPPNLVLRRYYIQAVKRRSAGVRWQTRLIKSPRTHTGSMPRRRRSWPFKFRRLLALASRVPSFADASSAARGKNVFLRKQLALESVSGSMAATKTPL